MSPHTAATTLLVAMMACEPPVADADRADPPPDSAIGSGAAEGVGDENAAACGMADPSAVVFSNRGVAAIRIGMSIAELNSRCRILSDSTDPHGNEGMPERRIIVSLGDSNGVTIIVYNDRVWRIELSSPRFRTADSIGVGSIALDLRRRDGRLITGDRGVFVTLPDRCGLRFQLADVPVGMGDAWTSIPDSTPVSLALVTGCD